MIVIVGLVGLVYVSLSFSTEEVQESRTDLDGVRTRCLSEAGLEWGLNFVDRAAQNGNPFDPLAGLASLFGGQAALLPADGEALVSNGGTVGEFTVSLDLVQATPQSVVIDVTASGYVPAAPANLPPGQDLVAWDAVTARVEYRLEPSAVFNYAYFINNWGWFYGDTIYCYGNARSNGQFDAAGYEPTVGGQPMYETLTKTGGTVDLSGYQDDNEDGLLDGGDGGIWSGWDVVGAQNVQGVGGQAENQHDFVGAIDMPNLSDLSGYEALATSQSSSIQIGGSAMSDAVYGDDPAEKQHLYLIGTAADPIVLDGPVVVRGDVIIGGYVTGQGAIYAGGNVYVPSSLQYVDPPSSPRPASNSEADTEAWLAANWDKDFLGLFAAENVVVGNFTNGTWRSNVGSWMSHSMNESEEDAGEDGIPNTRAGMDGILGTADDDVLEGDGVFTVETYTELDEELGLIPDGYGVGDAIPGSGEDIDGDGAYDDTTDLTDLDFEKQLNSGLWGGNKPIGVTSYGTISTLYANRLDAVFYTNHSFCWVVLGASPAQVNGAVVSRNEAIVYGTPRVDIHYDARLLGGRDGMAGSLLPSALEEPTILRWQRLDTDPNRYLGAP